MCVFCMGYMRKAHFFLKSFYITTSQHITLHITHRLIKYYSRQEVHIYVPTYIHKTYILYNMDTYTSASICL